MPELQTVGEDLFQLILLSAMDVAAPFCANEWHSQIVTLIKITGFSEKCNQGF